MKRPTRDPMTDYRPWLKAGEADGETLVAMLRRARVVDASVTEDEGGALSHVTIELCADGHPGYYVRFSAHGMHTEGWLWADVLPRPTVATEGRGQ